MDLSCDDSLHDAIVKRNFPLENKRTFVELNFHRDNVMVMLNDEYRLMKIHLKVYQRLSQLEEWNEFSVLEMMDECDCHSHLHLSD